MTAKLFAVLPLLAACGGIGIAQTLTLSTAFTPAQAEYVLKNFQFASGESLPELRIHYRALGTPKLSFATETI